MVSAPVHDPKGRPPAVQTTLANFREVESQNAFHLQNSKLLKVELDQVTVQAKLGSMVAYQGDVTFEHAGSGGLGRMLKKAMTGEGTQLMKVSGTGEVFLAEQAQDIHLLYLEDDFITVNGPNLLLNVAAAPTYADAQAAITWSSGVTTGIKTDVNLKTLIGRGSGETVQMSFAGQGWVLVQPSEGRIQGALTQNTGSGGGL